MKITLNKANKLRALLETTIGTLYLNSREYQSITLNGFEDVETIEKKIQTNVDNNAALIKSIEDGTAAIFKLRNLIQEKNATVGLNALISEIAKTNELVKIYSNLDQKVNSFIGDVPVASIAKMNNEARIQKSDATVSRYGSLQLPFGVVSTIDRDQHQKISDELRRLKKTIRDLEERRNELNHSTLFEIPTEIVEVLTENDLI